MMYENDVYKVPKEVLEMSHSQLKKELEKARIEMDRHPKRKPKSRLKRNLNIKW